MCTYTHQHPLFNGSAHKRSNPERTLLTILVSTTIALRSERCRQHGDRYKLQAQTERILQGQTEKQNRLKMVKHATKRPKGYTTVVFQNLPSGLTARADFFPAKFIPADFDLLTLGFRTFFVASSFIS